MFLDNLSSPPLLFFFLGAIAALLRSDLEIPDQVGKFLALYLLLAIGFKGGVALATSPLDVTVARDLGAALVLASVVPVGAFYLLRRRLAVADAAAIAATYGSISAVTFVTATSYLDGLEIAWSGHFVAAMALMESPAIMLGIALYRLHGDARDADAVSWGSVFRESSLNGSVVLIVGSLVVGAIAGPRGMAQVSPFVSDLFIGMLCLFLLDMGIVAARRLMDLRGSARRSGAPSMLSLVFWALLLPVLNGTLAGSVAVWLDLGVGDALLLVILGASASYIAVPAALRLALPQANPSVYLPMALAITFPFNLLIGIPLYHFVLRSTLGVS